MICEICKHEIVGNHEPHMMDWKGKYFPANALPFEGFPGMSYEGYDKFCEQIEKGFKISSDERLNL